MNFARELRKDILAKYPTIEALHDLAQKLDALVPTRNISVRATFSTPEYAAFTIIQECEKHGITEAQIRAAL